MIDETERPRFLAMNVGTLAKCFVGRLGERRLPAAAAETLADLIKIARTQGFAAGLLARDPAPAPAPAQEATTKTYDDGYAAGVLSMRALAGPALGIGACPSTNAILAAIAGLRSGVERAQRDSQAHGYGRFETARVVLDEATAKRLDALEKRQDTILERFNALDSSLTAQVETVERDTDAAIKTLMVADQAHVALLGQHVIHVQATRNRVEAMQHRETELRRAIDASGIVELRKDWGEAVQAIWKRLDALEEDPTRDSAGRSP